MNVKDLTLRNVNFLLYCCTAVIGTNEVFSSWNHIICIYSQDGLFSCFLLRKRWKLWWSRLQMSYLCFF